MLSITVELLTGRYHATPWGRTASEGDVEWPPAPWRLGRALVSAWHRDDPAQRPDQTLVDGVLRRLSAPPRFVLPPGAVGHSRHYMPVGYGAPQPGGRPTSSPVLDAFVRVGEGPFRVVWDELVLRPAEQEALERLVSHVGYLGRAESACVLRVSGAPVEARETSGAVPLSEATEGAEGEVVRVLCLAPDTTVAALSESTSERRRRGLDLPAGGRFVPYLRALRALEPRRLRRPRPLARRPRVLRFALEGPALPAVTDAMPVAELFRRAALARVSDESVESVRLLRGSDEKGRPLTGHRHCHYLPSDEDGDGRIERLTVWCPDGIPPDAVEALDVETLTSWALDHPLRAVLIAQDPKVGARSDPAATARRWRSHTPFVLVRHPRRRNGVLQEAPLEQVRLELSRRGLPSARVEGLRDAGPRQWGAFARRRAGRSLAAPEPPAIGARLEFAEPVTGPICLGRHSHFGLGLFLPER